MHTLLLFPIVSAAFSLYGVSFTQITLSIHTHAQISTHYKTEVVNCFVKGISILNPFLLISPTSSNTFLQETMIPLYKQQKTLWSSWETRLSALSLSRPTSSSTPYAVQLSGECNKQRSTALSAGPTTMVRCANSHRRDIQHMTMGVITS